MNLVGFQTELLQQDEERLEAPASKSSVEYLQWLETEGLTTLESTHEWHLRRLNAGNLIQTSGILLNLADNLDCLQPQNDSHLKHPKMMNIALWRVYWHALIAEMRTVVERCSPEVCNSGVFVLTTWPYKEFLRLMAGQLLAQVLQLIPELLIFGLFDIGK